jgi:hypothetical protein
MARGNVEMERAMAGLFGMNTADMGRERKDPYAGQEVDELKKRATAYLDKMAFQPGDIITWKPGLKNRKIPAYGEPVVVIEVFDAPKYEDVDAGTPMSLEALTGRFGIIDHVEDDLDCYPVDLARFEHYVAPEAE